MTGIGAQRVQKGLESRSHRPTAFRYYIHDTAEGYVLELKGPVTESAVLELSCCWQTAKPTLKNRKVTLDLREVDSVDEVAKQWLASMRQEGAEYIPESFLRDAVAGMPSRQMSHKATRVKRGFFGWLSNALACARQAQ